MTGVALTADQSIELPQFLMIKLPGIGEVNFEVPKINLPEISLPDIKVPGQGAKEEATFIDDNPNVTMNQAKAAVKKSGPAIKVGGKSVAASAPTLDDLKRSAGKNVTSVSIDTSGGVEYKKFPVRRLPGKNMSSYIDMARDL
eukprot:CAMPEP_0184752000 /NCGR_PEP_ID=MMETSP0315-20130426/43351_1 /TAXON_ID=101924 /ORGANISM="Rhodosorus marinus, Strain UTEX LB 2760" /LENGTH=142 /DNA_ID=CAMNT_0027231313 /DNA_START=553 /DNA_END=981 /DNA_ORIENTATION=-